MRMIRETYTMVEDAKCDTCGATTDCFRWYELDENGVSQAVLTQCGYTCDLDTDPRGAECEEVLKAWRA